jgi:hypothetical protein
VITGRISSGSSRRTARNASCSKNPFLALFSASSRKCGAGTHFGGVAIRPSLNARRSNANSRLMVPLAAGP